MTYYVLRFCYHFWGIKMYLLYWPIFRSPPGRPSLTTDDPGGERRVSTTACGSSVAGRSDDVRVLEEDTDKVDTTRRLDVVQLDDEVDNNIKRSAYDEPTPEESTAGGHQYTSFIHTNSNYCPRYDDNIVFSVVAKFHCSFVSLIT